MPLLRNWRKKPVTKNSEKRVPALRFKGFTNDWEQRKFENLVSRLSKTSNNESLPNVTYDDIKSRENSLNKDITKLTHGKKGIHFNKDDILFGKLRPYLGNILLARFNGIAVGDFWVLSPKDNNISFFLFDLIQTSKYKYISNLSSGSKMPRSDWNLVSKASFWVPIQQEQNKIGKIFQLIDNLVSLQQRKLRQLNFIRQGLTQNLFPDKDKIKPKVQFKGYKENWKITKAKNIFTEVDVRELPDRVILSTTQTGKVVTRSSLGRNLLFSKDKLKNYKLVLPGQFIIHLRSFKGGFATSELSGIVSPTYTIFDFKDRKQNDSNFWSILFTHYNFIQSLKSITEGIRYNGVTIKFNQFADLKITYPDLEIQSRLSQLIQCLDADIKKQKLKIQKFKKVKQFLLQNMFI